MKCGLVMPCGGSVCFGAVKSFISGATTTSGANNLLGLPPMTASSSFAQLNFNSLFAYCLGARDQGHITHMAMLHADIDPQLPVPVGPDEPVGPGWIDVLWEEMQATGATVISAFVPTKEQIPDPRVSTAIGAADDLYGHLRDFHLSDRGKMPATVTNRDVCGPNEVLMVNNALMLVDLMRPYWDEFAFECKSAIVKEADGSRSVKVLSEDWLMSRFVQAHGDLVAATWKVPLLHHGSAAWSNAG